MIHSVEEGTMKGIPEPSTSANSRRSAADPDVTDECQKSKKMPRTYSDYRDMLKEKDLDIVLIATPDHWHALPMIAAVKAGADVYVQKPISVDVTEGQAMLAAARKHQRVVQVGTQRRSTPHLIEAHDRIMGYHNHPTRNVR
jgi:predicted dehydrogenase